VKVLLRVGAIAMVLVLGGCHDTPKITQPATVLVVGDSLVFQSGGPLRERLEQRGWTAVMDARPGSGIIGGFSIGSWPSRIAALVRASNPDVAVVELGTNGCTGCTSLAAGIDAVMAPLRDVERVYWLNVRVDAAKPPNPRAVNAAIAAAQDRYENLHVVDMNRRFEDHPELVMPDRIHFNDAGVAAFAELVVDALPGP
jgi:lysophospholipase L1-like esterase